jgi:SAM-dependent methyltransferase
MFSVFPIPTLGVIEAVYGEDYFSGAKGRLGYADYDTDKEAMANIFERYLSKFEKILGGAGHLLDVGAATGFFMHIAEKRGWKTNGVEISAFAAKLGKSRGLYIETGTIHETTFSPPSFDAITMWDVIEHIPNPIRDIKKIVTLLKPGGLLAVNTPDSGSLFARIMGRRWHLLVPPEHIYYFNRKSLQMLLEKNGFAVIETGCVGKRFTLKYIVHMLYRWQGLRIWALAISYLGKHPKLAKLGISLNLRDNMFMLARKKQ